jgi:hypothetical protein
MVCAKCDSARAGVRRRFALFGRMFVAVLVLAGAGLSAGSVLAQEDLNRGKTPAQLFASDCAECHRNPRSISKRDNANALADYLRVHYTASRESAAAIAGYLVSLGGAVEPARPARSATPSRPKSQPGEAAAPKSGDVKSGDVKSGDVKSGDVRSGDAKPAESKPADPKPSETKPAETAPQAPAAAPASEPPAAAAPPANPG